MFFLENTINFNSKTKMDPSIELLLKEKIYVKKILYFNLKKYIKFWYHPFYIKNTSTYLKKKKREYLPIYLPLKKSPKHDFPVKLSKILSMAQEYLECELFIKLFKPLFNRKY